MKNEEVDECGGLVDEYEISNAAIKRPEKNAQRSRL